MYELTDVIVKEAKKLNAEMRSAAQPFHRLLSLENQIREDAQDAADWPPAFFGQVGAGTTSYKFAVNAIAKVFPF